MKYLIFISALILFQCHKSSKSIDSNKIDSTPAKTESDSTMNKTEEESECVFNNDYKGLTTEWLKELGKPTFIWIEKLKSAAIPFKLDTIFISKGGCSHFGISVVLQIHNDVHALDDSIFWANRSLQLAKEFKMEFYIQSLEKGKVKFHKNDNESYWFEVNDDNFDDNLIYNGIGIRSEQNTKKIDISQYYN
jgi:hypothetical protein